VQIAKKAAADSADQTLKKGSTTWRMCYMQQTQSGKTDCNHNKL